jgi:hypothetical protein
MESERIRWEAEAKMEGSGLPHKEATYIINQAYLESARTVLKVLAEGYANAGLGLQEFQKIMKFEIDGAVSSLRLTGIQQRYLETEFFIPPERKLLESSTPTALREPEPPKVVETIGAQINRLREEASHLSEEELAEKTGLDIRTVQRNIANETTPSGRNLRAYERVFSKLLNRQVVISKMP